MPCIQIVLMREERHCLESKAEGEKEEREA
jgi:hypothetical protein